MESRMNNEHPDNKSMNGKSQRRKKQDESEVKARLFKSLEKQKEARFLQCAMTDPWDD